MKAAVKPELTYDARCLDLTRALGVTDPAQQKSCLFQFVPDCVQGLFALELLHWASRSTKNSCWLIDGGRQAGTHM